MMIFSASIIAENPSMSTPTMKAMKTSRLICWGFARIVKNALIPSAELTGNAAKAAVAAHIRQKARVSHNPTLKKPNISSAWEL